MNSTYKAFCYISAIVSVIVCLSFLSGDYLYVSLLPISFIACIFFVSMMNVLWERNPLSLNILTGLLWIRMVLLPIYGSVVGFYSENGSSVELGQHFIGSLALCIYDSVAIIILFLFVSYRRWSPPRYASSQGLFGQPIVYFVFCAFAFLVYLVVGRSMDLFDFAIKPVGLDLEREGDIIDSRSLIIRQIINSGLMFVFFLFIYWFKKKYNATNAPKYFTFSLIIAILFITIISGERRTSQLYKAFATGYILLTLYPTKRRKTILYIGIAVFLILALMTVYKQFYAFTYGSYSAALQNASMSQGLSYSLVDAYFYGLDTIAKNIHYSGIMNVGIDQFFYDFFRNIFGLNFLVPGGRLMSTQIYNSIIYSGDQFTGLLISSVGYGFMFAGYVFAPFVTVFNVLMMLFFEKCLRRARTIEWQFVFAILFIRFAFGALGATPPLINLVTRFLVINSLIIGIARMFKIRIR